MYNSQLIFQLIIKSMLRIVGLSCYLSHNLHPLLSLSFYNYSRVSRKYDKDWKPKFNHSKHSIIDRRAQSKGFLKMKQQRKPGFNKTQDEINTSKEVEEVPQNNEHQQSSTFMIQDSDRGVFLQLLQELSKTEQKGYVEIVKSLLKGSQMRINQFTYHLQNIGIIANVNLHRRILELIYLSYENHRDTLLRKNRNFQFLQKYKEELLDIAQAQSTFASALNIYAQLFCWYVRTPGSTVASFQQQYFELILNKMSLEDLQKPSNTVAIKSFLAQLKKNILKQSSLTKFLEILTGQMVLFSFERFYDYLSKLMQNRKIFYSIPVKASKNILDVLQIQHQNIMQRASGKDIKTILFQISTIIRKKPELYYQQQIFLHRYLSSILAIELKQKSKKFSFDQLVYILSEFVGKLNLTQQHRDISSLIIQLAHRESQRLKTVDKNSFGSEKKDLEKILQLLALHQIMEDKKMNKEIERLSKSITLLENYHQNGIESLLCYFSNEARAELEKQKGVLFFMKLRPDKLYPRLKKAVESDNIAMVQQLVDCFMRPSISNLYYFHIIKGNYVMGVETLLKKALVYLIQKKRHQFIENMLKYLFSDANCVSVFSISTLIFFTQLTSEQYILRLWNRFFHLWAEHFDIENTKVYPFLFTNIVVIYQDDKLKLSSIFKMPSFYQALSKVAQGIIEDKVETRATDNFYQIIEAILSRDKYNQYTVALMCQLLSEILTTEKLWTLAEKNYNNTFQIMLRTAIRYGCYKHEEGHKQLELVLPTFETALIRATNPALDPSKVDKLPLVIDNLPYLLAFQHKNNNGILKEMIHQASSQKLVQILQLPTAFQTPKYFIDIVWSQLVNKFSDADSNNWSGLQKGYMSQYENQVVQLYKKIILFYTKNPSVLSLKQFADIRDCILGSQLLETEQDLVNEFFEAFENQFFYEYSYFKTSEVYQIWKEVLMTGYNLNIQNLYRIQPTLVWLPNPYYIIFNMEETLKIQVFQDFLRKFFAQRYAEMDMQTFDQFPEIITYCQHKYSLNIIQEYNFPIKQKKKKSKLFQYPHLSKQYKQFRRKYEEIQHPYSFIDCQNYLIIFASGLDLQIRVKMLQKFIQVVPEYEGKQVKCYLITKDTKMPQLLKTIQKELGLTRILDRAQKAEQEEENSEGQCQQNHKKQLQLEFAEAVKEFENKNQKEKQ